jgi:hypothetical protein
VRLVALIAILLVAGDGRAQAAEYFYVRIATPSHWRVLKIHGSFAENVKRSIRESGNRGDFLVEWSAFASAPQRYLAPLVIKDEYPTAGMARGLVAILDKYPMREFGVTWTGGIATKAEEFAHAERLFQLFQADPNGYERAKVSGDQGRDPLHPANHVGPVVAGAWWKCGWWKSDAERPLQTTEHRRRLEAFGLDRFSPKPPDREFSRDDLLKKFGQAARVTSKKAPANPRDPGDHSQLIITTWEYPGFTITTAAGEDSPDRLWIETGEAFEARAPLGHGVRVGQSIDEWARRLGRPACPQPSIRGDKPNVFSYEWEASYFADPGAYRMKLEIDHSGVVTRVRWEHGSMH